MKRGGLYFKKKLVIAAAVLVAGCYGLGSVYRLVFPITSMGIVPDHASAWENQKWYLIGLKDESFLIDKDGQRAPFDKVGYYSEGLAAYLDKESKLYGYMDETGETVIEPEYYGAKLFHNGMAAVQTRKNGPWGYIGRTGKLKVNTFIPQHALPFNRDYAKIITIGQEVLIDKDGNHILEIDSGETRLVYTHGLVSYVPRVEQGDPRYVVIMNPQTGLELRVYPKFRFMHGSVWKHDRLIWTIKGGDYSGNHEYQVTDLQLNKIGESFYNIRAGSLEGLQVASDKEDEKYGYIDRDANFVIKPQFDRAYGFSNGLAFVRIGDIGAYINTKGEIVFQGPYRFGYPFKNELAQVFLGNHKHPAFWHEEHTYINTKGEVVWEYEAATD